MSKIYYSLEDALKNPNRVRQLTMMYINRYTLSDWEQLKSFPNLKRLTLIYHDGGSLPSPFPLVLCELTQLESLSIENCQFTRIEQELAPLHNLRTFTLIGCTIEGGVTELLEWVFQLKQLENLSLMDIPLNDIPDTLVKLKKLKELYLGLLPISKLPAFIGKLKELTKLFIRQVGLNELPVEIEECTRIEKVIIEGTNIRQLPLRMSKWKRLQHISLSHNQLEKFPIELCYCKKLTHIDVSKNQLKEIPSSLSELHHLEWFNARENPLETFPKFIFDSDLSQLKWRFDTSLHNEVELKSLINHSHYEYLTKEFRQYYFYLHCNLVENIKKIPAYGIREAFNASFKTVKTRAVEYATEGNLETLREGSVVLVNTKLNQKKTILREKLSPLGIKVVNKITTDVTHVLVSFGNNTKLELLPDEISWEWITEAQLTTYINEKAPSYLIADSKVIDDASMVDKISELVMTGHEDNWSLAVELVKGGGLPTVLFTDLFIINKLTENTVLRKETKNILLENIQEAKLVQIIQSRKRLQFSARQGLKGHENVQSRILEWTTDTPIDKVRLAYACYQKMGVAQGLILNAGESIWSKKVIEQNILKHNGFFDLWTPDPLLQLPEELMSYVDLKGISCYIYGEKSLNYVKVPQHRKEPFYIPPSIANLKKLEKLELRFVTLDEIPLAALLPLDQLKEVLVDTKQNKALEQWKNALSNCTFRRW